jgi:hypothetical protein
VYVKVTLTPGILAKVHKRLQHHTKSYFAFEGDRGFSKRNKPNPHEAKMRFYEELNAIANPFTAIEAQAVFMTPLEAKELTRTVYAFEIAAAHITLPQLSNASLNPFAPLPADSAAAPPPPKPRRKDYPTF